jgi:hypothetical protein
MIYASMPQCAQGFARDDARSLACVSARASVRVCVRACVCSCVALSGSRSVLSMYAAACVKRVTIVRT